MGQKKHKPDIEVNEMFIAKCGHDWNRTFVGTIERYSEADGSKYVVGRIPVHDHEIIAKATTDKILGNMLDEMVLLILFFNLHGMDAKYYLIAGTKIGLN